MQWCLIDIPQVEEYQGMLENSGLVGYAQEVLKETDQSCFVQTAKQLHLRYSRGLTLLLLKIYTFIVSQLQTINRKQQYHNIWVKS